jgi:YidC/Oxa1 family membrane protein insertase
MQQKRILIALILSSAILFLWNVLFPIPTTPPTPKPAATPSPTGIISTQPAEASSTPAPAPLLTPNVNAAPQRTITIKTPLYDAKFDTLGAEPISWILKKNKNSGVPIYSVAGHKNDRIALELISPEGLRRQPRMVPLQLHTGDTALDTLLSSSTYKVEGVDAANGDVVVELNEKEKKQLTFVLEDPNGIQVKKAIVFDADRYETDLSLFVKRGEQVIPQVKVAIGPSVGDQGIEYHTFYSVAPEAISFVGDDVERHVAAEINANSSSPDRLFLNGPVDWAGVGDTYFGMVAVPTRKTEGLEYRTIAYEHKHKDGSAEKRYLVTGLVPILSDGSRTIIYSGPKDHYILSGGSKDISDAIQREIDLDGLIDYGLLSWLSRPIAVPILDAITYLYRLTGSYGVAIIIFTIVIYSLFFPLKWRSSKAMKKAAKLQPKMKELQEKIKGLKQDDPKLLELQKEQLRLMKEGNPLGGCLPLLIQMPFLFALYRAITISLDFRQASFLWIPDLSAAEPYMIHILPILMTGTLAVLQLVTPTPSTDPLQKKMMAIGMPVFMLYVLWSAPSGLVLYWLVGNIVGFTQQFLINRWTKSDGEVPAPPPAKSPPSSRKKKKKLDAAASGEGSIG